MKHFLLQCWLYFLEYGLPDNPPSEITSTLIFAGIWAVLGTLLISTGILVVKMIIALMFISGWFALLFIPIVIFVFAMFMCVIEGL